MNPVTLALAKKYTDLKVEQAGGGSSGVQVDWNQNDVSAPDYVKNRIAWTEIKEKTLPEDDNIMDKESVTVEGRSLIRIGDWIDLSAVTEVRLKVTDGITVDYQDVDFYYDEGFLIHSKDNSFIGSAYSEPYEEEGFTLSPGTWVVGFLGPDAGYMHYEIKYPGEINHQIDPKFLPEGGFGYSEDDVLLTEVELNEEVNGNKRAELSQAIGLQIGKEYVIQTSSGTFTGTCFGEQLAKGTMRHVGNLSLSGLGDDSGESFLIFEIKTNDGSDDRTIFIDADNGTKIKVFTKGVVHKIDPKYYDRLAWIESGSREILPETVITTADNQYTIPNFIGLAEGSKYTVTFDGIEYETECAITNIEEIEVRYIGNIALFTGDEASSTGEHFIIGELPMEGMEVTGIMTMLDDGEHTISISDYENIHKIDSKFLPTPDMNAIHGEPGYIANKPFGRTLTRVNLLSETTITDQTNKPVNIDRNIVRFRKDTCAIVNYDGVEYKLYPFLADGYDFTYDDYTELLYGDMTAQTAPFFIYMIPNKNEECVLTIGVQGTHTFSIDLLVYEYSPIEHYYFPSPVIISYDLGEELYQVDDTYAQEFIKANQTLLAGEKVYANLRGKLVEVLKLEGAVKANDVHGHNIKCKSLDGLVSYNISRKMDGSVAGFNTVITETLTHPQVDYAQNDESKPDYIKNRLAWTDTDGTVHKLDSKYLPQDLTIDGLKHFAAISSIYTEYGRVDGADYYLFRIPKYSVNGDRIIPHVAITSIDGSVDGGKTSALNYAKREDTIFAMNAGLFNTGTLQPQGQTIINGISITNTPMTDDMGTAISENECYPLCFDENGDLSAPYARSVDTAQMISDGVWEAVTGWGVVIDNYAKTDSSKFNEIVHPGTYIRQVIGQYDNGDYCILTVDKTYGEKAQNSSGLDYEQLANLLISKGVKFAYSLDGGGSAESILGKRQVNPIYDGTYGRSVPTVIYFQIE